MPFSNLDKWFAITSSITALSTTSRMLTGSTIDLEGGSPKRGYDLTLRTVSVYTGAINAGANASTSAITNTWFVECADDSAIASTGLAYQINQVVQFAIPASVTASITNGARNTQRISSGYRYAKVRVISPTAPGNDVTLITTVLEAILGDSTPA